MNQKSCFQVTNVYIFIGQCAYPIVAHCTGGETRQHLTKHNLPAAPWQGPVLVRVGKISDDTRKEIIKLWHINKPTTPTDKDVILEVVFNEKLYSTYYSTYRSGGKLLGNTRNLMVRPHQPRCSRYGTATPTALLALGALKIGIFA